MGFVSWIKRRRALKGKDVWVEVRGQRFHGTYYVRDGLVYVVADDGRNAREEITDSSPAEIAEQLLRGPGTARLILAVQ